MATPGPRYTLVGFSTELDWRPLRFAAPKNPFCVCVACGLVRPVTASLPCKHILCGSCYEQSAQGDERVCPLDGQQCLDKDVSLQLIPIDELRGTEVRCWNEQAGCEAVMAASHLTPVLCTDVHAHLRSECSNAVLSSSPSGQRKPDNKIENVTLTSITELLDQRTALIISGLERIIDDHRIQNQKLSEVHSSIEALRDAEREEFAQTSRHSRNYSARNAADHTCAAQRDVAQSMSEPSGSVRVVCRRLSKLEAALGRRMKTGSARIRGDVARNATRIDTMRSELLKASREALYYIACVIAQTSINRALYRFTVNEIGQLQAKVAMHGSALFLSRRIYLRGYLMSPGVHLVKQMGSASLQASILLHMGENDDYLEWPLRMAVKFSAVHPDSGAEWVDSFMLPECGVVFGHRAPQNEPGFSKSAPSFLLSELQRDGFVKDDRLLLKYELI
ncbi:hypothetical protein V5799_006808 [Amblyomma americanum]|uniref:TRAF1-6 MATH domain-containing protein n=1 Tax=Amblyomma americanum TaxID=6943 RepID=A0AAQ4DVC1_AMBAM